jgi:quinol monooxygenase YgiN
MLIVIVRLEVDPQALARVQAALLAMSRASWDEPGCLSYSAGVEDPEAGVVSIVERWESLEALQHHFTLPHMAAFNAAIAGTVRGMDAKMYDATNERPLKV